MLMFEEESINYGMICLVGWVSWMDGSFDVATTNRAEESVDYGMRCKDTKYVFISKNCFELIERCRVICIGPTLC